MNQFVLIVGSGLVTAALLAVAGVGFTLQFSVTNVLNVAYGSVMSAAAIVAYAVDNAGANLWVSGLAATATGAVLSLAMNRGVFKPFERRGAGVFTLIVLSLAIALILENALLILGGPFFFTYRQLGQASVRIDGVGFPPLAGAHSRTGRGTHVRRSRNAEMDETRKGDACHSHQS